MFTKEKRLRKLAFYWLGLSFQGGVLNMAGFIAAHRFISHMTGVASNLALDFYGGAVAEVMAFGSILLCFLMGSMVTAFFVRKGLKLTARYEKVFLLLVVLVGFAFVLGVSGLLGDYRALDKNLNHYAFSVFLSFICGMQNALFGVKSGLVVRTTHMTGTVTDLGHGLVNVLFRRSYSEQEHRMEVAHNWLRAGSFLCFVLGGLTGAFLFSNFQFRALLLPWVIYGIYYVDARRFSLRFNKEFSGESGAA
jgi:uncharacterized membrane protein YoaK (UPF0700 family)